MIKSYKIILIVQFFVLAIFSFVFYKIQYGIDFAVIPKIPLLLIGFSLFAALGISILIQRIVTAIIYSDTPTEDSEKNSEDAFWRYSFLANLILASVVFLSAIVAVVLSFRIGIKGYYDFGIRFSVFLGIAYIASLLVGLFLRIKDAVNDVSKLLGGLMFFLSLLIFGGALFLGLESLLTLQYPSNEVVEAVNTVPEVDETGVSIDSTAVAGSDGEESDEESDADDYYGFRDMDFLNIKSTGYFKDYFDENYSDTKARNQVRYLFADFFNLKKGMSLIEIRNEIQMGFYSDEFSEVKETADFLREGSDHLEDSFESYSPILYAFLSKRIYTDSNLNLLVEALIASKEDIDETEDPAATANKIYKTMIFGTKKSFPDHHYSQISPYISKRTLSLIKNNAERNDESEYSTQAVAVWLYSFWARREHEGNDQEIASILDKIQKHYAEE
jgi:hypothetical protein